MTEQFTWLAEIGNWPFYWPVIGLGVLIGIALLLYEIIDRFFAQRRGDLSNRLQWDDGYIDRISRAFKNNERAKDKKVGTNDHRKAPIVEPTKTERLEVL